MLISSVPVFDAGRWIGSITLIHDLSYIRRREAALQRFLLGAIAVLVIGAAASAATASKLRRGDREYDPKFDPISAGARRPALAPLLADARELVGRLAIPQRVEAGAWTRDRLRSTLNRHLHGERIVIVSNREPYVHERRADGSIGVMHPASGLVTALEPVMRACSGTWIAHGSGSADREAADSRGRVAVPPGEESYLLRRVWLSSKEEQGYYYGLANEGIWPLCHLAHVRPIFRAEDWKHYRAVNQKFADAVCAEVDTEDPIVLVQDYHLALVPRLIRSRLPKATILMFWHIPWPNAERIGVCPWRGELIDGMLGASILGFHTQAHCNNFVESVDRYLEARIDRERGAVVRRGKSTRISPYPISIEWPSRWIENALSVTEARAAVRAELGLPPDALLGVGVDRLDYTKGIEERLLAVERMLERFPRHVGRFTFVQLAAPSRSAIPSYQQLDHAVEEVAERINARFGREGYQPIRLLRAHHEPPRVFQFYRAADLCYVSSLHDGMNLVAKEFVAARDDEQGVLILSQFTGAASELIEALIVNPYDMEEASAALAHGLEMASEEQRDRMRSMRLMLAEFNVYRWAGRMLVDAAQLRKKDRLFDRWTPRMFGPAETPE